MGKFSHGQPPLLSLLAQDAGDLGADALTDFVCWHGRQNIKKGIDRGDYYSYRSECSKTDLAQILTRTERNPPAAPVVPIFSNWTTVTSQSSALT
jgi:hypothetical protein